MQLKVKQLLSRKYSLCQGFTEKIRVAARAGQRGKLGLGTGEQASVWWWWWGAGWGAVKKALTLEGFLSSLQGRNGTALATRNRRKLL